MEPSIRERVCLAEGNGPGSTQGVASKFLRRIRVLLVEHDLCAAGAIVRSFTNNNVDVTVARTLADARASMRQSLSPLDVVILTLRLPDGRGEVSAAWTPHGAALPGWALYAYAQKIHA
jgi:DNA-binding NtrC family response regulator